MKGKTRVASHDRLWGADALPSVPVPRRYRREPDCTAISFQCRRRRMGRTGWRSSWINRALAPYKASTFSRECTVRAPKTRSSGAKSWSSSGDIPGQPQSRNAHRKSTISFLFLHSLHGREYKVAMVILIRDKCTFSWQDPEGEGRWELLHPRLRLRDSRVPLP